MADKLTPLTLPPGMRNTGTVYQSKGRWFTGNFVRFFNGTIRPIWGWVARSLTGATISGVPRAMVTYRLNSGVQVIVIGTTRGLYAISGSVVYDITPAAVVSNNAARVWQLEFFGAYLVAVDLIAPSTQGGAYYWTGDTAVVAAVLSPFSGSNPTLALSCVATPERFLAVLGAKYTAAGWSATGSEAQNRMVTWATQEAGFAGADWVPDASNTAGDFTLTTDGALVCGRRSRGATLLWTTTDLWSMTYIGGSFVYRFDQVGNKCGIVSSNAAVVTDVAAFWMGYNGFYAYDGFVQPIPCDVHDYVFGSLNRTYAHYIWALENPNFGEVTWFYPHAAQTEITRYVTYNYREKHWTTGSLARTTGVPSQPGVTVYPVMCNPSASVFDHETGSARNAEGLSYLTSGPVELGDGDNLACILRVIPDDLTVGDVNMTMYATQNPDTAETTLGPFTLAAETGIRVTARQVRVRLDEQLMAYGTMVSSVGETLYGVTRSGGSPDKIQETTTNGQHEIYFNTVAWSGTESRYSVSAYVEAVERRYGVFTVVTPSLDSVQIHFDALDGVILQTATTGAAVVATPTITGEGAGWRIVFTLVGGTATSGTAYLVFGLNTSALGNSIYNGTATNGMYLTMTTNGVEPKVPNDWRVGTIRLGIAPSGRR